MDANQPSLFPLEGLFDALENELCGLGLNLLAHRVETKQSLGVESALRQSQPLAVSLGSKADILEMSVFNETGLDDRNKFGAGPYRDV